MEAPKIEALEAEVFEWKALVVKVVVEKALEVVVHVLRARSWV